MIRFQTLGSLDLRNGDSASYRELLGQHKRVALLAYLSIEYAGRFCRRDTLLGIFWPELETTSARNALSQALHVLRRVLGADVIVGRGQEEVGVDASRLDCDAAEFRRLAETGEHERAFATFTGDLLPGFFVSDAPEFERWLDDERASLRDLATAAAWSLSDRSAAAGRLRDAIDWANRARDLAPSDEPGLRRLLTLLDRAGNRAGALEAYDAFRQHLESELELEPSPETRALVARITSRKEMAHADATRESGERILAGRISGDGPAAHAISAHESSPRSDRAVATATKLWRRSPVSIAAAAAVLVLGGSMIATRRNPPGGNDRSRSIAVLPFTVQGDPKYGYLAEGVADLLGAQIADGRSLRSADAQLVLGLARRTRDVQQPDAARSLARRVGADEYVLGNVVEIGGRVEVDASLYDLDGTLRGRAHAGPASESDLFDLVDDLGSRLFSERAGARGADLAHVAEVTTQSLPALTAFLEGEADFRSGRYAEAVGALDRAVAADTSFAIAYYRLSIAHIWFGGDARTPMEMAHRYTDRLPVHQRQLVDAGLAWLRGENTRAEGLYRAIVAQYPDDVEAWNQLVEILFHTNAARGRDPLEALAPLHRVLAFDPDNADAIWHLALLRAGDRAAFDSLTKHALLLGPDPWHSFDVRAVRASVLGTAADRAQVLRDSVIHQPSQFEVAALRVAVFAADPRAARDIIAAPIFDRDAAARAEAAQRRARFDAAAGRIALARRDLEPLRELHFGTFALERAQLDLLPYAGTSRDLLRADLRDLASWDAAHDTGSVVAGLHAVAFFRPMRLHVMARLSARLGDWSDADRAAAELDRMRSSDSTSLVSALAQSAHAFILAERGDVARALAAVDSASREVWYASAGESAPYAQAAERFLRAELLERIGRDDEAVRWYASAERNSLDDVWYLAVSHVRRAQIYEREGRSAPARGEYLRARQIWREGDPEVVAMLREH